MTDQPHAAPNPPFGPGRGSLRGGLIAGGVAALIAVAAAGFYVLNHPERAPLPLAIWAADLTGANPRPVHLVRPRVAPLGALALLGQQIFFDPSLSASGRQSCASCHSPEHAYGPPNALAVQLGGPHMVAGGLRAPPSLAYLYRQAPFSIGPDPGETDTPVPLGQAATQARGLKRAAKSAGAAPAAPAVVPQAGLFWDGRSNTLQMQAGGPMMNPAEMANTSEAEVARKLAQAPYANQFKPLFGPYILDRPALLVAEAMSAVSRYQIEDRSFHAFDSKYDAWLEGKARLSPGERRGYRLFSDPKRANCAGCHLSQASPDGLPPLFTDTQYEALGVPRNLAIAANENPGFFDMGLCGPLRADLANQTQYCGMFLTPSLRNAATRRVFFHNGVYHSLHEVMDFYNWRDTKPGNIYPAGRPGSGQKGPIRKYDDLPGQYLANVDVTDAPFDRKAGDPAIMSAADIQDIIAFLQTLNDGYKPPTS